MNSWFRLYTEILEDPKVQRLSPDLFRHWINMLCLASKNEGILPPLSDISFALRLPGATCADILKTLTHHGLIDKKAGILRPHNWDARQYKSDSSTDRVKRFRERQRNVTETLHVTDQIRTDTETEHIQNRSDPEEETRTAFGEFGHALLTADQYSKLEAELGEYLAVYIDEFDRWVHEAPEAKAKDGVRRKDRSPYLSIGNWYRKALKEGRLGGNGNGKLQSKFESKGQALIREQQFESARLDKILRGSTGDDARSSDTGGTGAPVRSRIIGSD